MTLRNTIATELGLSTRSLNRRFKAATGMTPLAYLASQRLAEARELLRHSNLDVGEISWRVGLQDAGYFAARFRDQFGVSPLQYRKAVRGKLFAPSDN